MKWVSNWQVRCPRCGKTRNLEELGGKRIGNATVKRILGTCSQCRRWVLAILEPVPEAQAPIE